MHVFMKSVFMHRKVPIEATAAGAFAFEFAKMYGFTRMPIAKANARNQNTRGRIGGLARLLSIFT